MSNPFVALKKALYPIFHLEPMRNGRYIYPEIQNLKRALDNLQLLNKKNFFELLRALRAALPHIEKWHVDFNTIQKPIDSLVRGFKIPELNWDTYLAHSNASPRFQFNALNQKNKEPGLLPWLAAKSGATLTRKSTPKTQVRMLLIYKEHFGFSPKLSAHLKKDPNYLYRLIKESEKNFIQIVRTRLILYLTDQQLAGAIIKHVPHLLQKHPNSKVQATQLVDKLNNEILSNGISVSTLLRSAEARFILEKSIYFQIYQNIIAEKKQRTVSTNSPSPVREGEFKTFF